MRLPSVVASREIFSPSSPPEWLNMSSNEASLAREHLFDGVAAGGDHLGEPVGAVAERIGDLGAAREERVGDRAPVCSSFVTTSLPRRLRSRMSDSPEALSVC